MWWWYSHSLAVWVQAALSVKGWERLARDEIVAQACQAVAAVAREKSRNAELVYRLQQTHEEGIEAKQLKSRFAELQVGHIPLAPLVAPWLLPNQDLEKEAKAFPHVVMHLYFCWACLKSRFAELQVGHILLAPAIAATQCGAWQAISLARLKMAGD